MMSRQWTLAATLMLCATLNAQEIDDLEPMVDTSADAITETIEPKVDTSAEVSEDEVLPRAATSATTPNRAIDSIELRTSQITGNQELPQVLYIVPWKSSDLGDLVGRPVNTLLDEVLAPADREVFRRQIAYYEDLYSEEASE
ncbi:MAG: hypothetical protein AAF578_06610 [Pseudomonadota bacterium]